MLRKLHYLLGTALLFSCALTASSQEVFIGPKLGLSIHKASFNFSEDEDIFDQKIQLGYQIGGAFTMPLKNIFSFHSELYFSQKGKKTIVTDNGLENKSTYYFIEAPVLLRLNFEGGSGEAGVYKYHVEIGPTISYWLGGKGSVGLAGFKDYKVVFNNDTSYVSQTNEMVINGANRLQWGLNIGVGLEYPVKKNQTVFIDFRLVMGNSNLIESSGYSEFDLFGYDDDLNVHISQFVISTSYMFTYDWRLGLKGKSTINKRKQY
jgi:hypothetical protein